MNIHKFTCPTLAFLLLLPLAFGQTAASDQAEASGSDALESSDVPLGHGYVRRNGTIHFIGGGVTGTGANATRIDTPSKQLLKKVVDSKFGPFQTAEGVDVATFEPLSEIYARDKNHVYYKVISPGEFLVIQLPEADPDTFELLGDHIARDRDKLWYYRQIIEGIDPASVEICEGDRVFKDSDSVYYQYTPIAGAHAPSFRHLGSAYYADQNRVYWGPDPVSGADPASFEVLGDSFIGKDDKRVYRSGKNLLGLDAPSLELILHDPRGFQIFSDRHAIYVNTMAFPRSEPGKVEVIDNSTVKADDLILLVEHYHSTPVTVFQEDGKLMAEAPVYKPRSREVEGTIRAEVTEAGLQNIRIIPLPGRSQAPSVPGWQMNVFKRPGSVQRMLEAGTMLATSEESESRGGASVAKEEVIATPVAPSDNEPDAQQAAAAIVERDRMTAFSVDQAAIGFDETRSRLVTELEVSDAQAAALEQLFQSRKQQLADQIARMNSEEADEGNQDLRAICALIRNKGLRRDLEGILSPAQLIAFDRIEAAREREKVEARAYRDMAEINAVIKMTDSQKQAVLGVMAEQARSKIEREANARAIMSLYYGPLASTMDPSYVRGLANLMQIDSAESSDFEYGSAAHQQWIEALKAKRIEEELAALATALNDDQLALYRDYMEAQPAW